MGYQYGEQKGRPSRTGPDLHFPWWRGEDLNLRPSGYEPDELPDCSTPRRGLQDSTRPAGIHGAGWGARPVNPWSNGGRRRSAPWSWSWSLLTGWSMVLGDEPVPTPEACCELLDHASGGRLTSVP